MSSLEKNRDYIEEGSATLGLAILTYLDLDLKKYYENREEIIDVLTSYVNSWSTIFVSTISTSIQEKNLQDFKNL